MEINGNIFLRYGCDIMEHQEAADSGTINNGSRIYGTVGSYTRINIKKKDVGETKRAYFCEGELDTILTLQTILFLK